MSDKIIDFRSMQSNQTKPVNKKPDWTPEEIEAKIKPYIEYLNKTPQKFYSKSGDRWTEEENEEVKRLVFKYVCECYSCTSMAEEIHKYFPWRTENSILKKISDIKQKYYGELEKFYKVVATGSIVIRDAKMHYHAGKIEFGNYLQLRMLQMAGLIPDPDDKLGEMKNEIKENNKEYNTAKQAGLDILNMSKKKRVKDISPEEAEKYLFTSVERIKQIAQSLNIAQINTKNLLDIAKKMDNDVGEFIRGFEPIFCDKEKMKQWKRSERFRKQSLE